MVSKTIGGCSIQSGCAKIICTDSIEVSTLLQGNVHALCSSSISSNLIQCEIVYVATGRGETISYLDENSCWQEFTNAPHAYNFNGNESPKVTRYHWLHQDKVKDDFVRIANIGKKISVRSGYFTEIKTVQGWCGNHPWIDWEGKLEFVALLEYNDSAIFYVDVESNKKPEIGMRIVAHHGLGFLSDESRSIPEMLLSIIHYEKGTICASLKNEWLNVPVTLEVTGTITRSFNVNVFSMTRHDGSRHVNKIDKYISDAEECGVRLDDLTSDKKKSGTLFHELFLSDVKVEKIFVTRGSLTKNELKRIRKIGAKYGIPVEDAPREAYSICYCI